MSRNRALDQAAAVFLKSVFVLDFQGLKVFSSYSVPSDAAIYGNNTSLWLGGVSK